MPTFEMGKGHGTTMNNLADACYELLGIPQSEQPADHYRLLGLSRFESNRQVIQNASDCRMAYVRQLAAGPYSKISQELLNLLAEARICLLNHVRREQYECDLRCHDTSIPGRASADEAPTAKERVTPSFVGAECGGTAVSVEEQASATLTMDHEQLLEQALQDLAPTHAPLGATPAQVAVDRGTALNACYSTFSAASHPPSATMFCSSDALDEVRETQDPAPQWVLGAADDCDILIDNPYVSGRHCRLTALGAEFLLEDLASRNGTYVNGQRLKRAVVVFPGDKVVLGPSVAMPWEKLPTGGADRGEVRVVRIGRAPNNEFVIPDATVSQFHAELRFCGNQAMLSDLGSTNGTYLDGSQRRIERACLPPEGVVRFGTCEVPAARLFAN